MSRLDGCQSGQEANIGQEREFAPPVIQTNWNWNGRDRKFKVYTRLTSDIVIHSRRRLRTDHVDRTGEAR